VHVPHHLTWAHEHAEAPEDATRFRKVEHLGQLQELLAEIA
jgi:putative hydrolase of the HAD superfamily